MDEVVSVVLIFEGNKCFSSEVGQFETYYLGLILSVVLAKSNVLCVQMFDLVWYMLQQSFFFFLLILLFLDGFILFLKILPQKLDIFQLGEVITHSDSGNCPFC